MAPTTQQISSSADPLPPELAAYEDSGTDAAKAQHERVVDAAPETVAGWLEGQGVQVDRDEPKATIRVTAGDGKLERAIREVKARTEGSTRDHIPYPVPSEASLNGEFTESTALEALAETLIERHRLYAGECAVKYFWRDKGGKSKGRPVLGKVVKLSGLTRHGLEADFAVWIAADHCREVGLTHRQMEACLLNKLLQIAETEPPEDGADDFVPEPTLKGPDFEGFTLEYEIYGAWSKDLREIERAVQQMRLDLTPAGGE